MSQVRHDFCFQNKRNYTFAGSFFLWRLYVCSRTFYFPLTNIKSINCDSCRTDRKFGAKLLHKPSQVGISEDSWSPWSVTQTKKKLIDNKFYYNLGWNLNLIVPSVEYGLISVIGFRIPNRCYTYKNFADNFRIVMNLQIISYSCCYLIIHFDVNWKVYIGTHIPNRNHLR